MRKEGHRGNEEKNNEGREREGRGRQLKEGERGKCREPLRSEEPGGTGRKN